VDAFFTADGGSYVPGMMTRGPWGATMGGQIVGGLLGWALDRHGGEDLQPARLTVDLLRPVPIEPVSIEMSVQREGRRIKLVDAAMSQQGRVVARASALFLRRGPQPEGQVWSGAVVIPPVPVDAGPLESEAPFGIWTYSANSDDGSPGMPPLEWEQPGVQKFAWTRIFRPMVAGHPLTPFARAAFAGDIISSLTHWGTAGLRYINADYTVAISRLPEGEYIGLAAQTYYGNEGVGTGSATLFDSTGAIGTGTALALAQPAGAFQPGPL
jgi:Thioesterase-like superfamily